MEGSDRKKNQETKWIKKCMKEKDCSISCLWVQLQKIDTGYKS